MTRSPASASGRDVQQLVSARSPEATVPSRDGAPRACLGATGLRESLMLYFFASVDDEGIYLEKVCLAMLPPTLGWR